jgi:hypothetical protein
MRMGLVPPYENVPTTTKANKSAVSRRASQKKSPNNNRQIAQNMPTPVFRPIYKFRRVVEGIFDIICDGINPSLSALIFRLSDLPASTDFTNLFDMYRLTKIEIDWLPEYTELTDAALVSNAINVRFNSTIDISDATAPTSVSQVLEYQQVHSTGITQPHSRSFVPSFLMGGLVPCNCWLPTSNPNERHYAVKIGVPPTGVAMTFRSRVRYFVEAANVN